MPVALYHHAGWVAERVQLSEGIGVGKDEVSAIALLYLPKGRCIFDRCPDILSGAPGRASQRPERR